MKIALLALLLALVGADARAHGGAIVRADGVTEASAVCESGKPSRLYAVPADACWGAFEEAVDRLEFAAAAAAARRGCEKYQRGDYCAFMERFDEAKPRVVVVRAGRENERIGRALAYAAEFLWPLDVEDAEMGARALANMSGRRSRPR